MTFVDLCPRNSKSITVRMMKLNKPIDQRVSLCTCIFLCSSFRCQRSYSSFFSKKWHLWTFVSCNSKSIMLQRWNFISLLINMQTCAPAYFGAVLSDISGVTAPFLAKKKRLLWTCVMHSSKIITTTAMKLYKLSSACELVHLCIMVQLV